MSDSTPTLVSSPSSDEERNVNEGNFCCVIELCSEAFDVENEIIAFLKRRQCRCDVLGLRAFCIVVVEYLMCLMLHLILNDMFELGTTTSEFTDECILL